MPRLGVVQHACVDPLVELCAHRAARRLAELCGSKGSVSCRVASGCRRQPACKASAPPGTRSHKAGCKHGSQGEEMQTKPGT